VPVPSDPGPAALRYAGRGWSVVPLHTALGGRCSCRRPDCPAPGKHPRVTWQELTRAAAGEEQVAAWWRRWPDANVGVVTGLVSGLAVLDVDPRNGGEVSLASLEARWGVLPETVESLTGGGGRHLWLDAREEQLPSAVLARGLDLKAEGGLVVAPPSLHASGRRYAWLGRHAPEEVAPAAVPPWLGALAHGDAGGELRHPLADPPTRTASEQEEFAEAWARAGIELAPGDRYYLCPFHDDHHPSLHVDAEGCRWFCFGCRRGGGIGRLLQLLGEPRAPRPRARLHGSVGKPGAVTLAGEERFEVVGESLHQDELLALTGGRRRYGGVELEAVAELLPGPEHEDIVAVLLEGRPVGRLRREDAERLRPAVEEAIDEHGVATCRALVRGGWDRGRDDVGLFGVVLLLPADA
jgi:hypothetical protein